MSSRTVFGSSACSVSFTLWERIAPAELIANRLLTSVPASGPASVSASGRAIASPTMFAALTFSCSIARSTAAGSNRRTSTTLRPPKKPMNVASCAAPCISGATGNITSG